MNRHLGGIRPWDQVGGAKEIKKFLVIQPAAAADDFIMKHTDMCSRAAKRGQTQLEKHKEHVAQAQ